MHPLVWERKYEVDSLCYPVRLAYHYYHLTHDQTIFDKLFQKAMHTIVDTFILEQNHENSLYHFEHPIAKI